MKLRSDKNTTVIFSGDGVMNFNSHLDTISSNGDKIRFGKLFFNNFYRFITTIKHINIMFWNRTFCIGLFKHIQNKYSRFV